MIRVSAIVPATGSPQTLERCLAAIRAADDPPDELIVVDDVGPGPSAARNAGASRASGEILVFVDADVLPHLDTFRRIREAFSADTTLSALFGAYDDTPEAPGVVSTFRNLLHHHVHLNGAGEAATFWAGLGAIRRDAFARAGGFDADRYRVASVEDIDLGLRIAAAGGRIRLDPAVQATHLKSWSVPGMVHTDFARRGVPWIELLLRHRADVGVPAGSWTALNLGWRHRLSALAAVVGVGATFRRRPAIAIASAASMLVLNRRFYMFLARSQGPTRAAAGVGLHAVHHLTGFAALPVAAVRHLRRAASSRYARGMPQLNALGIVVSDMERSIRFYRLLGVDVPETPDEGHIDTFLPNGVRFMLDSEEVVRSFRPDWSRATGNQLGLAFECASAAEVDELYGRVTAAGFDGEKEPWDAFWGQRYAQLRDPNGVPVDLYASL